MIKMWEITKAERERQHYILKYQLPQTTTYPEITKYIDQKLQETVERYREQLELTNRESYLKAY